MINQMEIDFRKLVNKHIEYDGNKFNEYIQDKVNRSEEITDESLLGLAVYKCSEALIAVLQEYHEELMKQLPSILAGSKLMDQPENKLQKGMSSMTILTDHAIYRCDQRGIDEDEVKEISDSIKGTILIPRGFIRKTREGYNCCVVLVDNLVQGARIILTSYIIEWVQIKTKNMNY